MTTKIICPLYNGEKYINGLINSITMQKKVNIEETLFILTETDDNSEEILKKNKAVYVKIKPSEFSHSLTRETFALKSNTDIVVFITQDIVIEDELWLYNLTKNIGENNIAAAFSRQISKYNNLEKYTREKNYPDKSYIVSKKDIPKLGLRTFFFSDASSAIKRDIFVKLNGYDGKDLPTNEDMYIAYKLIMNNYKIKYCSKSVVTHSHNLTFKQLYRRYFDTGLFFKYNNYLNNYSVNSSGFALAIYILKRALQELNIKVLLRYPIDMIIRYKAMKDGEKYERHS